jgi:DNA-binding CsgD family transcriptional regulator
VAVLLAGGQLSLREIGQKLGISRNAVIQHVYTIARRLHFTGEGLAEQVRQWVPKQENNKL